MARSRINSKSKDLIQDDGAILLSVIEGEQIHLSITLNWITNLSGYTVTAKIIEADMTGVTSANGILPTTVQSGGQVTTLPLIDTLTTDNVLKIVIPENLIDNYVAQPSPEEPVYGWFGLEIRDTGVGNEQQVWKPMRGLVEILYSPSEEV